MGKRSEAAFFYENFLDVLGQKTLFLTCPLLGEAYGSTLL
jgi:hypothetical protein